VIRSNPMNAATERAPSQPNPTTGGVKNPPVGMAEFVLRLFPLIIVAILFSFQMKSTGHSTGAALLVGQIVMSAIAVVAPFKKFPR
jgi:hypothetical protein